jgi:hypothetical protein
MRIALRPALVCAALVALVVAGCGPAAPSTAPGGDVGRSAQQGRVKTITVGISNEVDALSIMGSSTTSGGWQSLNELHSQGLVTADRDIQRPIARLTTQVPTFENGGIELSPDGKMKTV